MKHLNERQGVTIAIFLMAGAMLLMAREDPKLWDVELFTIILQAVIISGIIGSIIAFHFAANKGDEAKTNNTAKAFDAITATAAVAADPTGAKDAAVKAADEVAAAAIDKADEISGASLTVDNPDQ